MNLSEAAKQRHSVRQYTDEPIGAETRKYLNDLIASINSETGLNIQIIYDDAKCFDSKMAHYGNFVGVKNYISLVGKKTDNELDEKLGYYGEKIVLEAQMLGLSTCWVAMSHGKTIADIAHDEKEVCIISIGYGASSGKPHKSKLPSAVSNISSDSPDWFINGVNAALLAPTAMNQQKFRFEYMSDGRVVAKSLFGFYTKLDLGIAKYHFEIGAERKI